ncbi:MAG TPA: 16S rRNA (guanine(527)-N(7))-methyltransferase RsmG [Blastocatellia bacterium]|nr:16S rRNA (guanine(527)-N(7))-methyltransferase RsmG [Blastocatellia bacterium]
MISDQINEFSSALESDVSDFGVTALSADQISQLVKHYDMICRWNKRINLTRIISPRDAARLHYAESLFGARFIRERTVLDIGSGAGFPAIPLAVIRPEVRVTALEANHKKALFLIEARDALRLANFEVVTARLEEFDWSDYELLTSRALDQAEAVLPLVIEQMSSNQRLMLYCGPDLIAKLQRKSSAACRVETNPIPFSESRILAILSH